MLFRRFRSAVKKSFRKIIPKSSSPARAVIKAREPVIVAVSEQLSVPPASPSAATLKPLAAENNMPAAAASSPNQDKRFKKTVIAEMMTFKQSAEHLATGTAGFADGWRQWIGLGGFSAGIAVLNTGIALLSAFGVLLAPVSAGIALGISLVGIVGAIGLNIYLNRMRRNQFARADKFMDKENIENEVSKIADALSVVLHDQLKNCTRNEAEMLAKASAAVITKAIFNGKIASFELLQSPASLSLILAKYASYAPQYKFQTKTAEDKVQNTRDILKGLVKPEPVVVVNVQRVSRDVPSTAAEREPLLAAVSGQSMFAKANMEQTRRFAPVPPATPSPRRMVL